MPPASSWLRQPTEVRTWSSDIPTRHNVNNSLVLSRKWGNGSLCYSVKVPYSSPNNPFPHSLLRTREITQSHSHRRKQVGCESCCNFASSIPANRLLWSRHFSAPCKAPKGLQKVSVTYRVPQVLEFLALCPMTCQAPPLRRLLPKSPASEPKHSRVQVSCSSFLDLLGGF